jgi:malonate transporter
MLGEHAARELNRFVVYLALPALLFDIIAHARWEDVWRPGFVVAFGGGVMVIFTATVALRWHRSQPLADAAVDALNASYANTAFLGFPLLLALLGPATLPLTMIGSLITVCGVLALGIILIEFSLRHSRQGGGVFRKVGLSLARNPLLIAPTLGAAVALSGLIIPAPIESFLKLLGGAASPCALVSLGLFLAQDHGDNERKTVGTVAVLASLKLVAQPLVTWLLAAELLHLPALQTNTAVLLAALPTGTGPYMLAALYGRGAATTSRVILVSTIVSMLTVPAYIVLSK